MVDSRGRVQCWGGNSAGQLGRATAAQADNTPAPIASLSEVEDLAVGERHACALGRFANRRTVACWGDGTSGTLGTTTGTSAGQLVEPGVPADVLAGALDLDADGDSSSGLTCVADGASVFCFGPAFDGSTDGVATEVLALAGSTRLMVSTHAICGAPDSGPTVCVHMDATFVDATGCGEGLACAALGADQHAISAGAEAVCVTNNGEIRCSGDNSTGLVGPSAPGSPFTGFQDTHAGVAVSVGAQSACGVLEDGAVACWGRVLFYSSGFADGTVACDADRCQDVTEVPDTAALAPWVGVSSRYFGSCALSQAGRVVCWGTMFVNDGEGRAPQALFPAP